MKSKYQVRYDAVAWAIDKSKDNTYHYGRSEWAHHSGCPICGTEDTKMKIAPKSQHDEVKNTWCCNPFITAAYHHGGGLKSVDCRDKKKRIQLANDPNPVFENGEWVRIKKNKKNLRVGDVLLTPTHAMLYCGDGLIVHAAGADVGPSNEKKWNRSIRYEKLPDRQWSRIKKIWRYVG